MAFVSAAGQKQLRPERGIGSSSFLRCNRHSEAAPGDFGAEQQRELHVVLKRHSMAHQHDERSQLHHFTLNEDKKPSTHDFLSVYDQGLQLEERRSSSGLSSLLTTHDFLQPLERSGARPASGDARALREHQARVETTASRNSTPASAERNFTTVSPNYHSIQVPYVMAPNSVIRMVDEAEVMRQARGCPSAAFSSRDGRSGGPESLRGVEVAADPEAANARENLAHWSGVRLKSRLPSDLDYPAGSSVVKNAIDNGHQSISAVVKQWTQGAIEGSKRLARSQSEEDEDDDEDLSERPKGNRKEPISYKGDAVQRFEAKNGETRGSTPRSKHSATEQRRRSKINDRFQMLRTLVPHSDQKRDKASFLLEVIEYVQVLQEKVQKYETAEQGRHQERLKSMVWDLCKRGAAGSADEASQVNALVFGKSFTSGVSPLDIKPMTEADGDVRAKHASEQPAPTSEVYFTGGANNHQISNRPACSIHSCISSFDGEKEHATALTAQPFAVGVPLQQALPLPYALPIVPSRLQSDLDGGRSILGSNSPAKEKLSDLEPVNSRENDCTRATTPDHQFEVRHRISPATQAEQISVQQSKAEHQKTAVKVIKEMNGALAGLPSNASASRQSQGSFQCKDKAIKSSRYSLEHQNGQTTPEDGFAASPGPAQPPRIQGGVINVSSVYSQGLLDTLTRALQSSGIDLSQANISVQIDLGDNARAAAADTSAKVATTPESSDQSQGRTRPAPVAAEHESALKRPKIEKNE